MTAAEIKEYLGMCIELEKEVYTQNRAIAQLRYNISLLGNYRIINEPTAPGKTVNENGINAMFWGMILAGIGGISIVIALPISSDFFLISGVLALLIGGGCCFFGRIIYDEDYKKAVKSYNKKAEQYKVEILNDAKRVDAERIKKAVLQSNMNTLSEANKKSRRCLQQLYAKDVLYSKYRNYACVCTLYEYFASGRCTTLEGHEGAYNILESELRLNRIITQNDQILASLEEIKLNQEMLYDSIQDANRKADQIIRNCNYMSNQLNGIQAQGAELNARIERLQTTSDLNLYVNACAKRELEYMNRANRIF